MRYRKKVKVKAVRSLISDFMENIQKNGNNISIEYYKHLVMIEEV